MRRVIVVGAGFFGRLVAARLRDRGVTPLVATRRGADLRLDAEDDAELRAVLQRDDVVIDTAGPFADRTTRLARVAIDLGADVIDLAESLAWSEAILALDAVARAARVRLYPACSAVAAVAGACVAASGITAPEEVDLFLAPASAETATGATMHAFAGSIGLAIKTFRDRRIVQVRGFTESRGFPASVRTGGIVEGAHAVLLPRAWPSLRRAEFWVDPNTALGRPALSAIAELPLLAGIARGIAPVVPARLVGRRDGEFATVVRAGERVAAFTFRAASGSYRIAVEPAVMAAEALARGATPAPGVVLPNVQVDPEELFARLGGVGIEIVRA